VLPALMAREELARMRTRALILMDPNYCPEH